MDNWILGGILTIGIIEKYSYGLSSLQTSFKFYFNLIGYYFYSAMISIITIFLLSIVDTGNYLFSNSLFYISVKYFWKN